MHLGRLEKEGVTEHLAARGQRSAKRATIILSTTASRRTPDETEVHSDRLKMASSPEGRVREVEISQDSVIQDG